MLFGAFMLTVQVDDVPLQSPDHAPKLALAPATAVSTTVEFAAMVAEQVVLPNPQFMPPADEVTLPVPATATCSMCVTGGGLFATKVAVTFLAALMVTTQVDAAPAQSPPQPLKTPLVAAAAVSVTAVPEANVAEQIALP